MLQDSPKILNDPHLQRVTFPQGITGWAEPGQLTALMGGSGAGKTTLMDCVAGRKTVRIGGGGGGGGGGR